MESEKMSFAVRRQAVKEGKTALGIEFGSTRIKAVLLDEDCKILGIGSYAWENRLEDGIWTYHTEDVWNGLKGCYASLKSNVENTYDVKLETVGSIGISAMMHGYLVFDKNNKMLVPFRTWRNTMTEQASRELMELLDHPIPQRWCIAHLYQNILDGAEHVKEISYMTTLAGYVHWMLTGEKVLCIDDASGVFPVDSETKTYYEEMRKKFDEKIADRHYPWKLMDILPKALMAGEMAGFLTEEGARLLDPTGTLKPNIPMCPPAGDGGTGMVATNSVKIRTGNVSAGTSIFAMIVLEKKLSKVYPEIDVLTSPEGNPVAMVHCNNGTSDLNGWVNLFSEFCEAFHIPMEMDRLYGGLYQKALEGEKDCGGLLAYNYFSGEHITGFESGRPLFVREQNSHFSLANFMKTHLYTTFGALKKGYNLLTKEEHVKVDVIWGHGGLFKTEGVGQKALACALEAPVSVMKTAGEGGAFGMAALAQYMRQKQDGESLSDYLTQKVFREMEFTKIDPEPEEVHGFEKFMERYEAGLPIERAAVLSLK